MRAATKSCYALLTAFLMLAAMSLRAMPDTIPAGPLALGSAAYQRHDYAIALLLLRPLAEQGVAGAQVVLGFMYHDGEGVPQDYAPAAQWMRKAAEQGDEVAEASLGGMYLAGEGVPKSDDDAARWLQKAADQGMAPAQFALGGLDDLHGKTAEALKWYRLAAAQGDAQAQSNVGHMYETGRGVAQSYGDAADWYRRAADQGLATAQYNLGVLYDNGHGVARDYQEAAKWYRLAAGKATPTRNTVSAFCTTTATACRTTTPRPPNGFAFAADQGYAMAQNNLGTLYARGEGVPKDTCRPICGLRCRPRRTTPWRSTISRPPPMS